jgi:hypothetical protein
VKQLRKKVIILLIFLFVTIPLVVMAQEQSEGDLEKIAKRTANPIGGEDWNHLVRPDFQLQSVPLDKDVGKILGLGPNTIQGDSGLSKIVPNAFDARTGKKKYTILTAQAYSDKPVAATEGATAGKSPESDGSDAAEQAKIAQALANPLSQLWMVFIQHDMTWYDGDLADDLNEDSKLMHTTMIQPVLSFQLTETWKTIIRPVITINSFDTLDNLNIDATAAPRVTGSDFDRKTGLGDSILWTAFSNQYKPPFVFGFGPTVMFPTASDDRLGSGKWSAGPMALAIGITKKWIIGGVFQHWWSFAGDDHINVNTALGRTRVGRPDVNLTDFQYIIRYRLSVLTNIGVAPNIRYNWEEDQLSLPIGMGGDTLVKIGKLPVKIGLELYHYVVQDDKYGPQWQLRFLFVPVLPAPKFSKVPFF